MNSRSELLHYVMQTDLVDIWEETRLDKNCVQVQVLNMLSLKIILAKVTKCKDVIGHILHAAFGTQCDVIITKNCFYVTIFQFTT